MAADVADRGMLATVYGMALVKVPVFANVLDPSTETERAWFPQVAHWLPSKAGAWHIANGD